MSEFAGIKVENADKMSELERLRAAFFYITNQSIEHIQNDQELAKAMADEEKVKLYHIQISMFRHAQSIFETAQNYAVEERWRNE